VIAINGDLRSAVIGVSQYMLVAMLFMALPYLFLTPVFRCPPHGDVCPEDKQCTLGQIDDAASAHSLAWEYHIYCDRMNLMAYGAAVFFAVGCLGSLFFAYFADRKGRKPAMIAAYTAILTGVSLASFTFDYAWFVFAWTIVGLGGNSFSNIGMMYQNELGDDDFNTNANIAGNIGWAIGEIICAVLASQLTNWRTFIIFALLVPMAILFPSFYFMNESKHYQEISQHSSVVPHSVHPSDAVVSQTVAAVPSSSDDENLNYYHLFSRREFRYKTLALCFLFCNLLLCYNGPLIGLSYIAGSVYINGVLLGVAEILGYLISGFIAHSLNRMRGIFTTCLMIGILFITFAAAEVPEECLSDEIFCWQKVYQMIAAMIVRINVAIQFALMYLLIAEVYPTKVRNMGLGFVNFIGSLVSIAAPIMNNASVAHHIHPMIPYGVISLCACCILPCIKTL
jgi:OCT family organic cation transporter-like MFS transporter 4/5